MGSASGTPVHGGKAEVNAVPHSPKPGGPSAGASIPKIAPSRHLLFRNPPRIVRAHFYDEPRVHRGAFYLYE